MYQFLQYILCISSLFSAVLSIPVNPNESPNEPTIVLNTLLKRGEPTTDNADLKPNAKPHPNQLEQVEAAFQDAFLLAGSVISTSNPNGIFGTSTIYSKYFAESDRASVKAVFQAILPNYDSAKPFNGNDLLSSLSVQKKDPSRACAKGDTLAATYAQQGTKNPFTVLCPIAFLKKAWTLPEGGSRADQTQCSDLDANVSWKMNILGATLLHEYLHYDALVHKIYNTAIIDAGDSHGAPIGYGPVAVRALAKSNPTAARTNADSYAYYAMEVFWTTQCGKTFKDPRPGIDDHDAQCLGSACTL